MPPLPNLAALAYNVLYHVRQAAEWLASRLVQSSQDAIHFAWDVRNGLHGLIDWLLGWANWWPFDLIRNWAHEQVNRLYEWALRPPELLRNWGNELYALRDNLDVARTQMADLGQQLLNWMAPIAGQLYQALPDWVRAGLQGLGDWVNARLGDLGRWVDGSLATVRDWAQARLLELVDLVNARLQDLRAWVDARLAETRAWVDARLGEATAPLWQWIASAQTLLDWLRLSQQQLQALLQDPPGYLLSLLRVGAWPLLEEWLLRVWDGQDAPARN